jgi:hypothetical protein
VVIDGENQTLQNIDLQGKQYVILRNFKLTGAIKNAIYIQKNSHHIVIEDCDISLWGGVSKVKTATGAANMFPNFGAIDAAIFCEFNLSSSVMQRNKIYNPRYDTNSWAESHGRSQIDVAVYNTLLANNPRNLEIGIVEGIYYKERFHPSGPQGISYFFSEKGNNVIRYNEIFSTNGNYLYDPIGGGENGGYYGFPGADSDVYGNYVAHSWDDAMEIEGGGENVRLWNNYMEKTYIGIANAVTSVGPLYIWRNVSGEVAEMTVNNNDKPNKLDVPLEAIPEYDVAVALSLTRNGNFKLKAGNIGLNRGECISNIIPLKTPDIGVQDSSVASMQFGTTYNFSTPNIYEECN